ncbi:MAG: ribosome small subunit-dependent GTPase A [Spirochaetaceae bacterium]|nr:ribosome small subunit-dependent GTPase A [Spirochaetaceae bacterium]
MFDSLLPFGWSSRWEGAWLESAPRADYFPARVVFRGPDRFRAVAPSGELSCRLPGALRGLDLRVGDWIALESQAEADFALVRGVLPRNSVLTRQAAGRVTARQVLAANVDYVFALTACGRDYSPARMERCVALAWDGGSTPVVVLNKIDLDGDYPVLAARLEVSAPGVRVVPISAATGQGVEELRALLAPGRSAVLMGSSGAGKSTLTNALLGRAVQATTAVRASDDRGRHQTTASGLFPLPSGGVIIDTPGVREVALWLEGEGLEAGFPDVEELAAACRFSDCAHDGEPGCAVAAAIASGDLAPERFRSYLKLKAEAAFHADRAEAARRRRDWEKGIAKLSRTLDRSTKGLR